MPTEFRERWSSCDEVTQGYPVKFGTGFVVTRKKKTLSIHTPAPCIREAISPFPPVFGARVAKTFTLKWFVRMML